jgi:TorA maturation chaperone TorD
MSNQHLQAGAEFYLCLARAFLPADTEEAWTALRDDLADNLEELATLRDYDISLPLAGYRSEIASIPNQLSLLQTYSSLFLVPPRKVSANTGLYLDGALSGGSVMAMEAAYRSARLVRSDDFKDLADHISIQLEFVGYSFLTCHDTMPDDPVDGARSFLGQFVLAWLPPFIRELQLADEVANPYLHLARILEAAVTIDANVAQMSPLTPIDKARRARAIRGVSEEDIAFIASRLSERGLTTDHLSIPVEQRDEAMGLSKKVTPSPRRGSRLG